MNEPSEFLKKLIGSQVKVKLLDGEELEGALEALDAHLNTALRDEEGLAVIRGNNVLFITPLAQKRKP